MKCNLSGCKNQAKESISTYSNSYYRNKSYTQNFVVINAKIFLMICIKTVERLKSEEEEQPYNINEVPVPSSGFKSEMFFFSEVAFSGAEPTNKQEDCSDKNVKAVETCCHVEC